MRVHHLDCITMCPLGGRWIDGRSWGPTGRLPCHCLLLETSAGLVLVDTGFGLLDVSLPTSRLSRGVLFMFRPRLRPESTAIRQIEALGLDPLDVQHIVLTHLDFDHAGGLDDFPQARVHLLEAERESSLRRRTRIERMRYRPQQWSTRSTWRTYAAGEGEPWFGFDAVRQLEGLPPEILLVPLIGHTLGHAGVAVDTGDGWLLHAGDAYFFHAEMDPERPRCTGGLRFIQRRIEMQPAARLWNQDRLRTLRREHGKEVQLFCAHDALELERLQAASGAAAGERAHPGDLHA